MGDQIRAHYARLEVSFNLDHFLRVRCFVVIDTCTLPQSCIHTPSLHQHPHTLTPIHTHTLTSTQTLTHNICQLNNIDGEWSAFLTQPSPLLCLMFAVAAAAICACIPRFCICISPIILCRAI